MVGFCSSRHLTAVILTTCRSPGYTPFVDDTFNDDGAEPENTGDLEYQESDSDIVIGDDGISDDGIGDDAIADDIGEDDDNDDEDYEGYAGQIPPDVPVYALLLKYSRETLYAIYKGGTLQAGMSVITHTRYGLDLALVSGEMSREMSPQKIMLIDRIATEDDLARAAEHRELEQNAFAVCRERIAAHGLEMKLVSVHYLHDDPKIMFFFSAENRVDFRVLVKDLVGVFKSRIELRQITARDESRIGGGFGICGRCYCCSTITDKLKPVSIKMAKDQNLSLNTAKISGPCGRLLCCLSYEHGFYNAERHNMPSEGCRIQYEGEMWRVKEVNPIRSMITLVAEDGRQTQLAANLFSRVDNRWILDAKGLTAAH